MAVQLCFTVVGKSILILPVLEIGSLVVMVNVYDVLVLTVVVVMATVYVRFPLRA